MIAQTAFNIFESCIIDYHKYDSIDNSIHSADLYQGIENKLYLKNWIDCVQWHCEDLIRNPDINPIEGMQLKRRIDALNQQRTDLVEQLDDYFLELFKNTQVKESSGLSTESPAWALDRLSILALKIYHMNEEVNRADESIDYMKKVQSKLRVLLTQKEDLLMSISLLLKNIERGDVVFKVYRQMKMYNDNEMNPVLRNSNTI